MQFMLKHVSNIAILLTILSGCCYSAELLSKGRVLMSEKSDSRLLLNEISEKMRKLDALQAEITNLKDHVNDRLQSVYLFADKVTKLKKEELENVEKIEMLKTAQAKVKAAQRSLLAAALLPEKTVN